MTYNQAINMMVSSGMSEEQIAEIVEAVRKTTVADILDLIDCNRDSDELVHIMDHNCNVEVCAMVCSKIWEGIENRTVNSMQARDGVIEMWLDD